jgi:hypothetical protein
MEPIVLVRTNPNPGGIAGTVRNARDNTPVANAHVLFFPLQPGAVHPANDMTLTDASGNYKFDSLATGTYGLVSYGTNFQVTTRSGISVGDSVKYGQDFYLSPTGGTAVIRIVLTWGSSPPDLDAHLTGPDTAGGRFHVYWNNRLNPDVAPYAGLDVDNTTDGGFPETITITRLNAGNYRFSVHDYTDKDSASTTKLGASGATVVLYDSTSVQTFYVPSGTGNLWTVFELSGNIANPTVIVRNSLSFVSDPTTILSPPTGPVVAGAAGGPATDARLIGQAVRAHAKQRKP